MTTCHMRGRLAVTLVELLVVVGILAVLVAILLPAIQSVRLSAVRIASSNQLRQVGILAQTHADTSGYEPYPKVDGRPVYSQVPGGDGVMFLIATTLIGKTVFTETELNAVGRSLFTSGADPSVEQEVAGRTSGAGLGNSSYGVNSLITERQRVRDVPADGLSNSIYFAERYSRCGETQVNLFSSAPQCVGPGDVTVLCTAAGPRRATFADPWFADDLRPTRAANGGYTSPDRTFQVRPALSGCDGRLTQASGPAGLLTAFADGSVHTIRPSVTPAVFWGLVTPDGGEAPGDW